MLIFGEKKRYRLWEYLEKFGRFAFIGDFLDIVVG